MKNKAKLILASAVFVAALMLLVPLSQIDISGGGGTGNSNSDSIVLSDATNSNLTSVSDEADLKNKLEAGTSVQLSKDIVLNLSGKNQFISIKSNNNETTILDLNGKTLTINTINDKNSNRLVVADGATVTIKNGTIVYKGDNSAAGKSPIRVGSMEVAASASKSILTLDSVNITSADYGVAVFSNADLTVNDSNITAVSSAISTNGNPVSKAGNSCGSSITINGGQYTSTDTAAIYFPGGDNLTVTDGTFTGKTGFDIRSGTIKISGATINVFGSPNEVKSGDGPTSWGMGIAVFNMSSYGQDISGNYTTLDVTVTNTPINNAVYNVYVGDYHIDTDGTLKTSDLASHEYSPNALQTPHSVTLNSESKPNIVLVNGTRSADGAVPLTIDINNHIFANGNAITISDGINNNTSKITYGNHITFIDNFDLSKFTIFGGNNNDNATVTSTSITMNGGTVACLYGGGYGTSADKSASVGTASIKITGGNILATVFGGGLGYATVDNTTITISDAAISLDVVAGGASNSGAKDASGLSTSVNTVTKATVNISGGTVGNSNTYGGVYGGGQSLAYVETSEINVTGGTIYLLCASGSNGITGTTNMIIDGNAKITYLLSVNRGVINNSEINIKSSFTGTIDKLALGALSDWDNDGKNNNQFAGGSTDGAVIESVTLNVECSELNSSDSGVDTQVFLGRGLYSNYGNAAFTCDGKTYYQHYAYSSGTLTGGESITTPIAANITVSGNVNVIAYVGNTTNDYDPTTFIIGDGKTWTFENGAMITPHDVSNKTTAIKNDGKLIFDGANVGEDGLVLTCGGDIEIKNTKFTTKGLYISGANDVTITGCTFTNISDSPLTPSNIEQLNAIYIFNCTGNVQIGGANKDDGNTISSDTTSSLMRGIFVIKCGGENSNLIIKNNSVSDVKFNALQLADLNFKTIRITNNTISNWDADADSGELENYEGGRAIRMKLFSTATDVTIENNVFIKSYVSNAEFKPSLGKDDLTGYDDGNILKMTILDTSKVNLLKINNNVLALGNITNYYDNCNMFKFEDSAKQIIDTYKVVILNPNGGYYYTSSEPGVLCSIVAANDTVSEPTDPSRSGSYSFDGWYDAATGGNKWDFATTISADTTLYAKWTYTGGSGVPVTPPTDDPKPEPEPIVPDKGNVTVPPIDEKKADELIHEAVSSGSDSIPLIDTSNVEGEYTEVTVSKSDLETISKKIENNNNINSVSIETSEGDIILEKEVLNSILETTDADSVSFEIEDAKDKLTDAQKEAVGDRPVYDINITAGNENITSFNGKTITISLPYTLKAGEDPENIVVYYVKEDGSLEKVNCTYKDGKVIFETDHLSKYVIGYEESDKPVTPDTPDDKKDDNNTIYYAVAAIVVILIIIALAYYFMKKKQ